MYKKIMVLIFLFLTLLFRSIPGIAEPSSGKTISLNLKDAEITDVLQVFGEKTGLSIVTDSSISGKISIFLKEANIDEALHLILDLNGYNYRPIGTTLLVSASPKMSRPEVIKLKYMKAAEAKAILGNLVANIQVDEQANSLIITDIPANISRAKELLNKIDSPLPQVMLEAKIMEVGEEVLNKYGFKWPEMVSASITFPEGSPAKISGGAIAVALNFLESQGKAKTLANTKITTLQNKTATIFIGDQVPYTVTKFTSTGIPEVTVNFVNAGVKLSITPQVNEEGYITTTIRPEVSSIYSWVGDIPWVRVRQAETIVRVKNGETIVLGGLINSENKEGFERVPVLGWIPILEYLFTYKTKRKVETELVIMVTPHILSAESEVK